ncbi:MAG: porin [Planctomycetaceae bacterium]
MLFWSSSLAAEPLLISEGSNPDERLEELQSQLQQQALELEQLKQSFELQQRFPVGNGCTECDSDDWISAKYDDGLVFTQDHPNELPFQLKLNSWGQVRYHNFNAYVDSWTDNAGVTRPVYDRNSFDIERARLTASGYALDERLVYYLQIDGDSDGQHQLDFFMYYWGWEFSDAFKIHLGKKKVPASRQWLLSARRTRLADRPMATDFLRPDLTVGIFVLGELPQNIHYEMMIGNGYSTSNFPDSTIDDRLSFAATNYIEPLGDFGPQIVDFNHSPDPLVRFGHSFVYSPFSGRAAGVPTAETSVFRLTDGTLLTQPGALAPGVTVSDLDVYFYSIDAALKWMGWSITTEVYFRWLEQIKGNGALPVSDLLQHGFFVEGGYFLIPKKFDVNLRYSEVKGLYGHGTEATIGCNYYPLEDPRLKFSFDVTRLVDSPLQNSPDDIFVGDDGMLYRSQIQFEF